LEKKVVDDGITYRIKDVLNDTLNCAIKIHQLKLKKDIKDERNWTELNKKFEQNLLNICEKTIANKSM
jgi:hypothetical protein